MAGLQHAIRFSLRMTLQPNTFVKPKQRAQLEVLAVLSGRSRDHFVSQAVQSFLDQHFETLVRDYSAQTIQQFNETK